MKLKSTIFAIFMALITGVGGAFLLSPHLFSTTSSPSEVHEEPAPYSVLTELMELKSSFSHFEAEHLARLIWEESEKYGIDPFYILAIIEVESSFDPSAVSSKGAIGLMQLLPSTACEMSRKMGMNFSLNECKKLLFNPYFNVKMGIAYFSTLIDIFKNRKLATLAYFWGIANVRKFLLASYFPSDTYLQRIMLSYNSAFNHFLKLAQQRKQVNGVE